MVVFLIYYWFLDWLRLNCMEVFHYVTEKLRVYLLFENGNKSIKINKFSKHFLKMNPLTIGFKDFC